MGLRRDLRMKTLYLSGRITGEPDFRRIFSAASDQLQVIGFDVVNPVEVSKIPYCACSSSVEAHTWECNLRHDIIVMLLQKCQGIAMLPGWEESRGAQLEHFVAVALGLQHKTVEEWLHV